MIRDSDKPSRARTSSSEAQAAQWLAELEEFPARLLLGLPDPVTLRLDVPGAPVPVCFTTAAIEHSAPVLAPAIVFDRDDLGALLTGVESERMWRRELLGLCFEKWRRPALRVTASDTLAGALPETPREPWTVRQFIERLGASIVSVELAKAAQPHTPALPAAA